MWRVGVGRHHARHAAAVLDRTLYLSGGRIVGLQSDARSRVERWNPKNSSDPPNGKGRWEENVVANMGVARASHAMCASK